MHACINKAHLQVVIPTLAGVYYLLYFKTHNSYIFIAAKVWIKSCRHVR